MYNFLHFIHRCILEVWNNVWHIICPINICRKRLLNNSIWATFLQLRTTNRLCLEICIYKPNVTLVFTMGFNISMPYSYCLFKIELGIYLFQRIFFVLSHLFCLIAIDSLFKHLIFFYGFSKIEAKLLLEMIKKKNYASLLSLCGYDFDDL